jgi:hypothetical protein
MVTGSADWHMAYAFAGYLGEIRTFRPGRGIRHNCR